MSKTRVTLIFNGAKFDYEIEEKSDEVIKELNKARVEGSFIKILRDSGRYVEFDPKQIPLIEIVPLGGRNDGGAI